MPEQCPPAPPPPLGFEGKFKEPIKAEVRTAIVEVTKMLSVEGKGFLTADESPCKWIFWRYYSSATLEPRFRDYMIDNTQEMRRRYRQMLFSTDCLLNRFVVGAVMHEETVFQNADDGRPLIRLLEVSHGYFMNK